MNIYKQFYAVLKKEIFEFGKTLKRIQYADGYWESVYDRNAAAPDSWNRLLSEYLFFCCTGEERKFIDLYLFQKSSLVYVSMNFPLSERACQEWREEIFKNLIGLAMQRGIFYIDILALKK